MLLAVDVGNTQTVIGLFEGDSLAYHWRIATCHDTTSDEIRVMLRGLFELRGLDETCIDTAVLSSVVPALTELWQELVGALAVPLDTVSSALDCGLSVHYDNPAEIGADRIADAVAAIETYGAPVIVVDLGTATNIEVIDDKGAFLGGIIAPGLVTSADALFVAAARLSRVDLEQPDHVVGANTRAAVQSGLVFGEVARIDGLVRRAIGELGYDATVIATGGLAARIAPLCETVSYIDEDLTLTGLRIIHERLHS